MIESEQTLGPDLHEDTDMSAEYHVWLEQFQISDVLVAGLEFAHVSNVLKLVLHKGTVRITLAVHQCQYGMAIFPAILACQPSGRLVE